MAKNVIRGGVASIFSKRFFRANNKYINSFNPDNESKFGLLLDANNLYGGFMEKLPILLKDFQKVEIDPEHPDYLQDQHKDFFLLRSQKKTLKEIS